MPQADLPESLSSDSEPADSLLGVEPVAILVFDEESGEFINAASSADSDTGNTAPMPVDDADTDDGSDWIVNIAEDSDATVIGDLAASADTSASIDWDAEAGEVNDLLPPPPPGRSGMKHGQGAPAA